jgi:hypothetical protein
VLLSRYRCYRCGSLKAYHSRPHNFLEKYVLPIFLHRTIRCGGCGRRFYKPIFMQAWKRDEPGPVTPVVAPPFDVLHPPVPAPYTEKNSSGSDAGSMARAEEVRLQQ